MFYILPEEKKARLENDFGIYVGHEMKERIDVMCNYSAMVERHGIEQGIQTGKILARYEDGMLPIKIAEKMGMNLEQAEAILVQNGKTAKNVL